MKIFLLSDGKSIHTKRWVDSLLQHNHNVYLFSLNEVLNANKNLPIYRGITNFGKLDYILSIPMLDKIVKEIDPDIIHAHYLTGYGSMTGRIKINRPLILSPWGSDVFVTLRGNNLYSKFLRYLVRPALEKATYIITETIIMADILRSEFSVDKNRLKVIPGGIDLGIFNIVSEKNMLKKKLGIPEDSFVITSIRNITEFYRIHEIVKAIPKVLNSNKNINIFFVFVAGYFDSSYLDQIKENARKLNISQNLLILDRFLSPKEVSDVLNISDIVISIPPSDNLPKSILEGMACGCIPVVSNTFGTKELSENSKFKLVFTTGEADDLAEKLIDIINRYSTIKNDIIPWNLNIVKEKYSWEFSYMEMENLYKEAIEKL
jgi:glycosyltransferase involved in cell wall biosynthesis